MSAHFSFEVVNALDYDKLRPDYAPHALAWVAERGGLVPGSVVVDLAAGTGQLSRRFMPLGVDLVAVEPAANMRAVLAERLPAGRVLGGTAESIPLGDDSVDAVVVGSAFHRFDRERAFAGIACVLRPGRVLALFWAWPLEEESLRYPGLREVDEVVESTRESCEIATAYRTWTEPAPSSGGVRSVRAPRVPHDSRHPLRAPRGPVRDFERRGLATRGGAGASTRPDPAALAGAARDSPAPR
jgi:SAM-dependent methyltransferase